MFINYLRCPVALSCGVVAADADGNASSCRVVHVIIVIVIHIPTNMVIIIIVHMVDSLMVIIITVCVVVDMAICSCICRCVRVVHL